MRTRSPGAKPAKRRNLSLPDTCIDRITAIREKTDAASDSEVVRRAIKLYEVILSDRAKIVLQDQDGHEAVMPATLI
jgi:Arc/MetJ-type ribon-helix-helix transcriptional regulator